VFDPIGVLSPVTVKAKIFWQQNLDWDEPLTSNAEKQWLSIAADIQNATSIILTRQYLPGSDLTSTQPTQLFVFADASLRAYGAVTFICNNNRVSFVMAKSRVEWHL